MSGMRKEFTKLYLAFVFIVLPVIFHDHYADIRDFKVFVFWKVAFAFGVLMIGCYLIQFLQCVKAQGFKESVKRAVTKVKSHWHQLDTLALLFALVVLLSSLCSRFGINAFTGNLGFRVGGYLLLALCLFYFLISRNLDHFPLALYWFAPVLFLELTTILNSLNLDPLKMHTAYMTLSERVIFVSTIGHINYLGQYFCLFIPFFVVMLFKNQKRIWQIIDLIIIFLGYVSALIVRENSLLLGLFFGLFVTWLYSLGDIHKNSVFLKQLLLWGPAGLTADLLNRFIIIPQKQLGLDQAALLFVNDKIYLLAVVIVGIILWRLHKNNNQEKIRTNFQVIRKVAIIIFSVALLLVIAVVIYCCIANRQLPIFNNRVNIWRGSINSFYHMTGLEKLIGVGPDCVAPMLDRYTVYQGVSRTTAHNEILQVLISLGLFGLVIYLSFYVVLFRKAIRKKETWPIMAGLAGYLGVSLVVGPSFLNVVTIFTLLALLRGQLDK